PAAGRETVPGGPEARRDEERPVQVRRVARARRLRLHREAAPRGGEVGDAGDPASSVPRLLSGPVVRVPEGRRRHRSAGWNPVLPAAVQLGAIRGGAEEREVDPGRGGAAVLRMLRAGG